MTNYKPYINALRACAKEHKNDVIPFAYIRTTELCNDTADLLEELEKRIDEILNGMERYSTSLEHNGRPDLAEVVDICIGIVESNIGE